MELKTFAFDLDGTLCTLTEGEYEAAEPFMERIRHVNNLYDEGHTILIFTARGATSKRDLRAFTMAQLSTWGVKFHELVTGKPHFDLLVDDKAISDGDFFEERVRRD